MVTWWTSLLWISQPFEGTKQVPSGLPPIVKCSGSPPRPGESNTERNLQYLKSANYKISARWQCMDSSENENKSYHFLFFCTSPTRFAAAVRLLSGLWPSRVSTDGLYCPGDSCCLWCSLNFEQQISISYPFVTHSVLWSTSWRVRQ